jgi:CheY-like chemotaxis protein
MDERRLLRILVVDDNRPWADALAGLLRLDGHTVNAAYDGSEAIEAAVKFLPEVVMLDLRMPRLSGYTAARVFSRHPAGTRPLLIAMSALDREEERIAAVEAGFDHYLAKPIELPKLKQLFATTLGRG